MDPLSRDGASGAGGRWPVETRLMAPASVALIWRELANEPFEVVSLAVVAAVCGVAAANPVRVPMCLFPFHPPYPHLSRSSKKGCADDHSRSMRGHAPPGVGSRKRARLPLFHKLSARHKLAGCEASSRFRACVARAGTDQSRSFVTNKTEVNK